MKNTVRSIFLFVISLVMIFSAGCMTEEMSTEEPATVPTDTPTDVPNEPVEFPIGEYDRAQQRLSFKDDGTFTVWIINVESFSVEDGKYTIEGDQIIMTDELCGPDEGKYTWRIELDKLIFELIEDTCESRRDSLAGNKWLQKP